MEEITITHIPIYYNDDCLENNSNNPQDDNVNNEEKQQKENEIINLQKDNIISIKQDNQGQKEEGKEKKNDEDKKIQTYYINDDEDKNYDKISFCHMLYHNGIDIDISTKEIFECYEYTNARNFLVFKKSSKIKTLLFFEEHYLYILKDIIINKDNVKLRRINNKIDLNKLFQYKIENKDNDYLFIFDFLKDETILERDLKKLLFKEKDAIKFEEYLLGFLEYIDAAFFDKIFENNNEENEENEVEEDEKDEKKNYDIPKNENENINNIEDNININELGDIESKEDKEKKKGFKKIIIYNDKDINLKIPSSRIKFK